MNIILKKLFVLFSLYLDLLVKFLKKWLVICKQEPFFLFKNMDQSISFNKSYQ